MFAHLRRVKAPGIRNVRNHLLQYPENADSGAVEQNWSFGGSNGPVIKPHAQLPRATTYKDPGLFVNAREFRDNIDAALRDAIGS
jgi:hypothetical protein